MKEIIKEEYFDKEKNKETLWSEIKKYISESKLHILQTVDYFTHINFIKWSAERYLQKTWYNKQIKINIKKDKWLHDFLIWIHNNSNQKSIILIDNENKRISYYENLKKLKEKHMFWGLIYRRVKNSSDNSNL